LTPICTESFVGWASPRPNWGSLQRSPSVLVVFMGLLLKGWEGGWAGREFVLSPRKKKEKSAPMLVGVILRLSSAVAAAYRPTVG